VDPPTGVLSPEMGRIKGELMVDELIIILLLFASLSFDTLLLAIDDGREPPALPNGVGELD